MKKFKIISTHDNYITSYEQGDLENTNIYDMVDTIIAENVKEAISNYFENILYFEFNEEYATTDGEFLYYNVLVKENNAEVLESDIAFEEWKNGDRVLYSNIITLSVEELVSIDLGGVYQ